MTVLELKDVKKYYKMPGGGQYEALRGVNAKFVAGEMVAIVGESGSGKSTLMNTIGGLDSDFEGAILYEGKNLRDFSQKEMVNYHKKSIGFIFQNFNLIPHLDLIDNVSIAMTLSNADEKTRRGRAEELLTQVGLKDHMHKKPDQLSGGQKQRVAIARALANDPDVIIADEPTGALDADTTDVILNMIRDIAASGKLVLMVTHSDKVASHCSRVLRIDQGQIVSDQEQKPLDHHLEQRTEVKIQQMSLFKAISLAFKNMKAKFGRNALVSTGMGIGIMSVILMLSLGKGVTSYVSGQMSTYSNPLVAEIQKTSSQKMRQQGMQAQQTGDKAALAKQQQNNMASLSGTSSASAFSKQDLKKLEKIAHVKKLQKGYSAISLGTNQLKYGKKTASMIYLKTVNDGIAKSEVKKGHLPKAGKDEVMIDSGSADNLGKKILGKKVKASLQIGTKTITKTVKVVGIYEASGSGQVSTLLLPYSDLAKIFKDNGLSLKANVVYLMATDKQYTSSIKQAAKDKGFAGSMQEQMAEMFDSILSVLTYVLTAIAAVSLLVSAIMILVVLNISVVERTQEIGVMKALGARRKDIRRIFSSEAFLLGLASGIVGIALTWLLAQGINSFTQSAFKAAVVSLTPQYALTGLLISIVISMIAGILPANHASKLDPVEALRKE
ncbi:ABC transporter ATP-binding protein [Lactobacillus delbrueckii subsp. lactis DSM 20072]|uniref:ABC transporter ATP-binding protein/permease n=1 Tax=Lactobacillus delbrueckii TaxID=1584 RepID=UPI000202DA82|nr:ABC transporter ATP-binding protein/permease [Lactobacillus delbrueckii]ASW12609.1 ABC transporter ATP-binding protein [Lactobacillus delbrueckii subsp. lactis DSM 20072]EGD27178.1 ABC superfamily ATP binding cassette transporter ATP-binding and permease [Lactobacillus delbrueckii subsp. lactis DSM 20072]KRK66619.1 abc superfamily atp binding cassette transporter atp-binding and permease [Lactobacillus delbrueckii subsp. lactis DSM 20072]MCT3500019.1 ABC transporter ATP-binding protein/perme